MIPTTALSSKHPKLLRKSGKSAGRRRPVIEPALGIEIRGRNDGRNRKHRGSRRLEKGKTGGRGGKLQAIAEKMLSLGVERPRFYGSYLLVFGTLDDVTSGKTYRQARDSQENNCNPAP